MNRVKLHYLAAGLNEVPSLLLNMIISLTLCLLVSSADNLCKHLWTVIVVLSLEPGLAPFFEEIILSLPLIQVGQLSVTDKEECTMYLLTLSLPYLDPNSLTLGNRIPERFF